MRYAIKFGYDGTGFVGYARQPNFRTVEGKIINVLLEYGVMDNLTCAKFQSASRTDKGVSAYGNVVAFNTAFEKKAVLSALNAKCKDIWFHGIAEVEDSFNPRYANERWYRYFLYNKVADVQMMKEASLLFIGEHDFKNFAKHDGKNPVRTVNTIDICVRDGFILIDIKAQSFLWNMVRRIVRVLERVSLGDISIRELKISIDNEEKFDFGLSPPEPLVLMDVAYDFKFDFDLVTIEKLRMTIGKEKHALNLKHSILQGLLDAFEPFQKALSNGNDV